MFCTVTSPDGLIFYFDGPFEGQRHDLYLLTHSAQDDGLRDSLLIISIKCYACGDAAYINHVLLYMISGFHRAFITPFMSIFNTSNNRPRTYVQWNYKYHNRCSTPLI